MCIVWKMTADIVSKRSKDTYTNTDTIARGIVMRNCNLGEHPKIRDYGSEPFVFNIRHATNINHNFRTTLWTGQDMQLTLMCIPACGDIGVEIHPDVDQFIRVESGKAKVYMGSCRNHLQEQACVDENIAILIPAGTWHNIVNVGVCPLKLYSLYTPPRYPYGTVHRTKEDAECEEH